MANFTKWWVYMKIDEDTQLPCIWLYGDVFFIHWKLSEGYVDEEGMIHVIATHPTSPEEHP